MANQHDSRVIVWHGINYLVPLCTLTAHGVANPNPPHAAVLNLGGTTVLIRDTKEMLRIGRDQPPIVVGGQPIDCIVLNGEPYQHLVQVVHVTIGVPGTVTFP